MRLPIYRLRDFSAVISVILVIFCAAVAQGQQRNPPGVNPGQYQQGGGPQQQPGGHQHPPPPPPPQQQQFQGQQQQQQFQPPPQQFQGQPQQPQFQGQQQPPVQQQQFQQQPVQVAGDGHHHPQAGQQVLHRDMSHEKEHMKEHMDVPIDTSNMSEQELQFHYFKMHDADGNNKLDGCELVKSLIHWHDQSNHDPNNGQPIPEAKIFKDEELVNMIDPILATDDRNKDGYIEGDSHEGHDHEPPPHYEDDQLTFLIDPVLKSDDIDKDGMISYAEYIAAQIKNRLGMREGIVVDM